MRLKQSAWWPTLLLLLGCALLTGVRAQIVPELESSLGAVLPTDFGGMPGVDVPVTQEEAAVAAFTDYAFRVYENPEERSEDEQHSWASVYVGFYDQQTQGHTIHSPRNCLPGAGWEVLSSRAETLPVEGGPVVVNRYLLQNGKAQALVLYWYQGRGRVAHNEYLVKWDLMRDAVLKRRTDEALVRVVVPIVTDEEEAFAAARALAVQVKPALDRALPSV